MSVELVNGHVLLPNHYEPSVRPQWARRWQTEIADAVTGAEARQAMRAQPRIRLTYRIVPADIAGTQMLDDRLRAALKLGKACCPLWGRGADILGALVSDVEISVGAGWPWQAGDYVFLGDEHGSDALLVTSADLLDGRWLLGLDAPLTFNHLQGSLAWPLLFGRFSCQEMNAVTPRIGPVTVTIAEMVSSRSNQIGAVVPPAGAGIGAMQIGSTFEVS